MTEPTPSERVNVVVRSARLDDAESITKVATRSFYKTFAHATALDDMERYLTTAFDPRQIVDELRDPLGTYLVGAIAEVVVGFAKLVRGRAAECVSGRNPLELARLYVEPDRLGQGVGGALMRACLELAKAEGHDTLWLGVWERNDRALRFYRGWGFEIVGAQIFTVGEDDQNDHVMQRPISGIEKQVDHS